MIRIASRVTPWAPVYAAPGLGPEPERRRVGPGPGLEPVAPGRGLELERRRAGPGPRVRPRAEPVARAWV